MMMVLYYNNFFTIYNDIIKFYKFYVHNRMANAIPCNYFIPAIERYCTISNLRLQLSLLILHGIVGTGIMSGEAYGRKTRFLILFFFFFLAIHVDPFGNTIIDTNIIYYRKKSQRNH